MAGRFKIVVLDDDPTGSQTVHSCPLLLQWDRATLLEGLARHKDELGGALCPCRHYEDKEAEVAQAFWNCPCVPMRERKECHCMLFLTEDNPFRGEKQTITLEEVKAHCAG